MPIRYSLHPNPLTNGAGQYAAQVHPTASVDIGAVVERMLRRGSTVSRADAIAVLEEAVCAVSSFLREGYRVNFAGLVELYPSIRGNFNGALDSYDAARHSAGLSANAGSRVRSLFRNGVTIQKVEAGPRQPSPVEFIDLVSGSADDLITPGSVGTLNGYRLDYCEERPDEGIFLISQEDGAERKIELLQKNKPGQLVFMVPADLPAGLWALEVRKRFRRAVPLRAGQLDALLRCP